MVVKITKTLELRNIQNKIKSQNLPIKTAYKFSKLFASVDTEADFYGQKLQEIINTYAEKDEAGNPIPTDNNDGVKIQKELLSECQEKLNELFQLDVELPDIKFTLNELESLEISVDEFSALLPFIEE